MFIALYVYDDFHPRASGLLEQEYHAASMQFEKYSEAMIYVKFQDYSTMALEVLEDLRLLGCEEIGGLSDPGPWVPNMVRVSTVYRMGYVLFHASCN